MRTGMVGSLVEVLRRNLARRASRVRVFEVGRVFRRDAAVQPSESAVAGIDQPLRLGGLAYGPAEPLQWGARERAVDFFDVKGDVETLLAPAQARFLPCDHPALHPGRSAWVEVDGQRIGMVGELHPRWRQAYELPQGAVVFELDVEALLARQLPAYQPLPRQQPVLRDLALVVGEATPAAAVLQALREAPHGGLLRDVRVFDVYRPEKPVPGMSAGERSLAVRVDLLDDETPLTDARCDALVATLLAHAQAQAGARLRGA
jgi:phenylalanyl-tRNA synthetase beta chain